MSSDDAGSGKKDKRRERLAASLRENLKRRKTQQRLREAQKQPERSATTSSGDPKR